MDTPAAPVTPALRMTGAHDPAFVQLHIRWLIRLRWLAIACITTVVSLAWAGGAIPDGRPHLAIALALSIINGIFWFQHRDDQTAASPEREILKQIIVDLIALSALLHWSDGVENPFSMFFILQVAIASMLTERKSAYGLALFVMVMQTSVISAEHLGLLAHHPLGSDLHGHEADAFIGSARYLFTYLLALGLTLFGTVYFMQNMALRHRRADARRLTLERLATSRERLAYVGELSAGLVHSIRNPVHGMLNCVALLRTHAQPTADVVQTLDLLDEGLQRVSDLTTDLLMFSRSTPSQPSRVPIEDVIDKALRFMRLRDEAKLPTIHRSDRSAHMARIDPSRMAEALVNVLDNAVDACAAGGDIYVTAGVSPSQQDVVFIEVRDTGIGIDEEELSQIFDPFFSNKAIGQGTGLGLSITRHIVEAHGGEVQVESQLGRGSSVRLVLKEA